MWSVALDTWWYSWSEVPTRSVLDWARLPARRDEGDGTLWWVDTDVGEILAMLRTGPEARFEDLAGAAVPAIEDGATRLFHPTDGVGLDATELWRDRVTERGLPVEAQVLRPVWDFHWDSTLMLALPETRLGPLLERGWKRYRDGLARSVGSVSVELEIAGQLGLTAGAVNIAVTADGRTFPSSVLSNAVRSEVIGDAVRLGADPPLADAVAAWR